MHRWSGCPVADANKGHYRVPNRLIVKGLYPSLTFTWRPKIPRWQTARKEDDNSWIFWFLDDLSPELTPFKSCEVVRDCVRVVFISIDFELNLCVAKWNMSKCSPNRWQVNVCHKLTEKKNVCFMSWPIKSTVPGCLWIRNGKCRACSFFIQKTFLIK